MRSYNVFLLVAAGLAVVTAEEGSRGERGVTPDNFPYSHLCEDRPDQFICANCKTLVMCVKGQAFTRRCIDDHFCAVKTEFGGGVCYPGEPAACTCQTANSFQVDPYDPQRFFACKNVGSKPEGYKCPDGMTFDQGTAQCKGGSSDASQCTMSGTFANPTNCSEYNKCIPLSSGWLQKSFTCNSGLMFNEKKGACEDPCHYQFVCQQEGRYPDLLNRRNYFECYVMGGKMTQDRFQCPDGYKWKVESAGVGNCVEDHDEDDGDYPFSRCHIPDGFCP
ncbi:uncharacterized protein LOC122244691 [Penaeus japonicus]|uniref:uncharacterized protein LOC122244691 n=1 Tax=Penaeus japonicus TaxID=27405 RepID=UPI001C70C2A9|nr:uncharacterized protein LOC122244691 [Penaeus japonicus]